jgi:hypothetical protein
MAQNRISNRVRAVFYPVSREISCFMRVSAALVFPTPGMICDLIDLPKNKDL